MTPDKPTAAEMAVDLTYYPPCQVAAKRAIYAEHRLERATELLRHFCKVTGWEDRIEAAKFLEEAR